AGIVDEDVDFAEGFRGAVKESRAVFFLGDVGSNGEGLATFLHNFGRGGADLFGGARGDDDGRAFAGKRARDGAADTASSARDDGHPALQDHASRLILGHFGPGNARPLEIRAGILPCAAGERGKKTSATLWRRKERSCKIMS